MPFGFNVTGQLAVTVSLAIFTFVIYIVNGNGHFWSHQLWMPGVPIPLRPVLAIIELAGTLLIKPFSLAVRLFANITAGHIVVMSLVAIGISMQKEIYTQYILHAINSSAEFGTSISESGFSLYPQGIFESRLRDV